MTDQPTPSLRSRAAALLGWTPLRWRAVRGGYTPAARYLVSAAGSRAFVKVGTTPLTAGFLRREAFAYERIKGPFVPRFMGWQDHDAEPMLIIEDLSEARWPPPWDAKLLDAVLEQVDAMHRTTADLGSQALAGEPSSGWSIVAENPEPFLSLRLASKEWLVRSLATLIDAEAECAIEGTAVTHFDLRSDNMCLTNAGVKFIDWAEACLGNPKLDLGFWLPSLCFEGGPQPDVLLPDAPEVAAWVSGFFAARAGLPDIADAPLVRRVQREQLSTALPWAQRALDLREL